MIQIRPAHARGHANHDWLDSYHSFSFADYYDPAEMGWGVLRVINEDRVAPGKGFGMHHHRDMEIISYVLSGALQHRDNMGNGTIIRPADIQRMSAGKGIMHSEFNPSDSEVVHFLQIWIQPQVTGIAPEYEQKTFDAEEKRGRLRLIASPNGHQGSVTIHQDVRVYATLLAVEEIVESEFAPGRFAYLHLIRGALTLNGIKLNIGDGAKIKKEPRLTIRANSESEFLLFDLPAPPALTS
ncbi:putative quercetin 2,3-dioxygenase sll1773 [Gammaproteobacteria bacterium]